MPLSCEVFPLFIVYEIWFVNIFVLQDSKYWPLFYLYLSRIYLANTNLLQFIWKLGTNDNCIQLLIKILNVGFKKKKMVYDDVPSFLIV